MEKIDFRNEPYERVIIPDSTSGSFTALVAEFPGCVAQGDSIDEAYSNLEIAADSWIAASEELGHTIPLPALDQGGGKLVLRLPKSLHRQLVRLSKKEEISLNQFVLTVLAERVGTKKFS